MTTPRIFMLGLSGPPGAGKTTLSYLFSLVYPNTLIVYADDFCKEEHQLAKPGPPIDSGSVDSAALCQVLDQIKITGRLPDSYVSWYSTNITTPEQGVRQAIDTVGGQAEVDSVKQLFDDCLSVPPEHASTPLTLVIVDGFLLVHDAQVRQRLDLTILLRTSEATARARRNSKAGFGPFAQPGEYWKADVYNDVAVWQNYVKEHAWLFVNGNPEGEVLWRVAHAQNILPTPAIDWNFREISRWTSNLTARFMRKKMLSTDGAMLQSVNSFIDPQL